MPKYTFKSHLILRINKITTCVYQRSTVMCLILIRFGWHHASTLSRKQPKFEMMKFQTKIADFQTNLALLRYAV